MSEILEIAKRAKIASRELCKLKTNVKNEILNAVADEILLARDDIKMANIKDIEAGQQNGLTTALIDRLTLTDTRIDAMARSVRELANFADPIGGVVDGWRHTNGMQISKVRVPLGVIGMIYESRPNVTIDAASLALKSGNAIVLRGSSFALNSNKFLCDLFCRVGDRFGLLNGAVQLISSSDRNVVDELIRLDKFIDVLIPRGGKNLKNFIIKNATIPVIETGEGVCHIYVDESADVSEAVAIIKNAKTQRPSVCNAVECVLLHKNIVSEILPLLVRELSEVELRLSNEIFEKFSADFSSVKNVVKACESDFGAEFLDLILAVKSVSNLDEAIVYINEHASHHSDAILSQNFTSIEQFLNEVDSAVVYANASTRFSDGGEFGFGGEIGISTQKLHARGPMGARELTTYKYVVRGSGQVR